MPPIHRKPLVSGLLLTCTLIVPQAFAQSLNEALTGGQFSSQFRLRYEGVEQDNALADADALTLRSAFSFTTGNYQGFSGLLEMEDVRTVLGMDEYTVGPAGVNPGLYSVIADPDTTELNQGYIQYSAKGFTAKLGRQVITHDTHRHVGSVPWRQDWQTFDAFSAEYAMTPDLELSYQFLDSRERIFAEKADLDTTDHLFRAAWDTGAGSLTAYAYLLEVDDTPVPNSLDTWGLRYQGSSDLGELPVTWLAEYATQDSESGALSFNADYLLLEGGVTHSGVTAKLGYERLGSDKGAYGFSTPLATLHAFNGWADLFLATPSVGLEDSYLNLGGKILGGNLTVVFHDFTADDAAPGVSDLGREFDLQYVRPFAERYTLGFKYADFKGSDIAPDTEKVWLWLQARF